MYSNVCSFESFINRRCDKWLKKEKSRLEYIFQSQIVDVLEKNGLQKQKSCLDPSRKVGSTDFHSR
ncbi:hypothetical protein NQ318_002772 [Aromia moschata]|uniref:Uncharacterized protein n=1 Tax=Aromia moschata TaxID=1265417 RepID=A0AAV8X3M2_9CUCU|nr:hypothetical protein NQ318_002772 [Aromia moschata]